MDNSFRAWMLPEGVEEALPTEAIKLNILEQTALNTFMSWGYELLRPPMLEYADTFIADDNDGKLSEQMIQFKDQKTGKQLGLRPDITPQIARIDAHYLRTDKVARYAYSGEVVRSYPAGHGSARNPIVTGVELLGSQSWQADVEVVSLLIEYLQRLGLSRFTVALGNVDIVAELLKAFRIKEKYFDLFFDAFSRKDSEKLFDLCKKSHAANGAADELLILPLMYGGRNVLQTALKRYDCYPAVLSAVEHLQKIAKLLEKRYPGVNFSFDLSDVHGYGYHNGLIFSAYINGLWQAVARGGRYDSFGNSFGEKAQQRASIGFNCYLNLLSRVAAPAAPRHRVIACHLKDIDEIQQLSITRFIKQLHSQGDKVIQYFDDGTVPIMQCTHQIMWQNETWQVQPLV